LFNLTIPTSAALGLYTGMFNLLGGTGGDLNLIGTQTFQVNVVPEPDGFVLIALGCAGLAMLSRRGATAIAGVRQ
jgi:hypothetical protein